ncbi:MAG: hypothetical protein KDC07_12210 [Chitinophagaceae bacterium]|nr:hypothetical protein [Chitinophagaceae bacterium]MCB9046603.1 hypothetical protein [Chitinophagales bacterium]
MNRYIVLLLVCAFFISCRPEVYTPKPRGYFQIDLPEKSYTTFDSAGFPYKFEYPTYGKIVTNPDFFGDKPENPYWINIEFPSIGGKIYISYKYINKDNTLEKVNGDFYHMTYTVHEKKADYIQDFYHNDNERKVYSAFFNVTGDAASAYQFYATDSVQNYMRGALYFEATPNADSLKPVNEFLKKDISHLIETIEWK